MRRAVWYGRQDVRVEDAPEPLLSDGSVLIEVSWCGLCGTDVSEYYDGPKLIPQKAPHPLTKLTAPMTLGHEFSGVVVEVGAGVRSVEVGDRVTVDACWRCGECYWCRHGAYNICEKGGAVGLASHGGLAERVAVPEYMVYRVPDNVSDEMAAMTEPLAVGFHAVRRGGLQVGETVVVLGAGMIGLAVAAFAREAGARAIYLIEPNPQRRNMAEALGAEVFPPSPGLRGELMARTSRIGADLIFDTVGSQETMGDAVRLVRRGGRIVVTGIPHQAIPVNVARVTLVEASIIGSLGYAYEFDAVLALMSRNHWDSQWFVSNRIGLQDVVWGLESIRLGQQSGKVLVRPGGSLP